MSKVHGSRAAGQSSDPSTPRPLSRRARKRERRQDRRAAAIYAEPLLAIRSDGAVLVSTAELAERDLAGRKLVTYMVLTAEENTHVVGVLDGAFAEVAARVAAKLPKRGRS